MSKAPALTDSIRRSATIAQAVWSIAGRPVLVRAMGATTVIGISSAVLFSPAGMKARDLVHVMHGSVCARVVLWIAWILVASPATAAAFDAPGTNTLRSLGLTQRPLIGSVLVLLCVGQLPWAVLFARGAGLLEMAGAVLVAVATGSASIAALHRRRHTALALAGAAVILLDPRPLGLAVAGALLAPLSVNAAWRGAIEHRRGAWRIVRPTHAALSLYITYLLRLERSARSRLIVAWAGVVGGVAGLLLSVRNNPTDHPWQRALAVMTFPLFAAAGVCVAPVLECEARLRPLFRSLQVRRSVILVAFLSAVATPASALAASAGLAARAVSTAMPISVTAVLVAWGSGWACVVGLWGRRHERMKRPSAATFATGVTLLSVFASALVLSW